MEDERYYLGMIHTTPTPIYRLVMAVDEGQALRILKTWQEKENMYGTPTILETLED